MVGILATTLVQSSSVTTSMVVALVAAPENPLPVVNAIPMIMGSNIGTTVTNSVVSLAHMRSKEEFRRAFAVATCHDFFNFIAVAVLLPLEIATGFLGKLAGALSGVVSSSGGFAFQSPLKGLLKIGASPIASSAQSIFQASTAQGTFIVICSAALIFAGLFLLVRVLRTALLSNAESRIDRLLGGTGAVAIVVGIVVTVMVQSSSITTSLLVPFAAAGVLSLKNAFPVTLGANIGTTVTALVASLAVSGVNAQAGVTIALAHLLFNLAGTLLVYPFEAIRSIPLNLARGLADVASRSKKVAIVYVVTLFYALPALFAYMSQ